MVIHDALLHYCLIFYLKFIKFIKWNPLQILTPNKTWYDKNRQSCLLLLAHHLSTRQLKVTSKSPQCHGICHYLKMHTVSLPDFKKTITILKSSKTWNNDIKTMQTDFTIKTYPPFKRKLCNVLWTVQLQQNTHQRSW